MDRKLAEYINTKQRFRAELGPDLQYLGLSTNLEEGSFDLLT